MPGILYVLGTPIGNLKDITLRALEVLRQVDRVACEDTRVTSGLLRHHGIAKPLVSYHEHNERKRSAELVERLMAGESVALVSDAGTPGLSDPGAQLVSRAAAAGIRVVPIPGPSALAAILSVAGDVRGPVVFVGFTPSRSAARKKFLDETRIAGTYCFYESPHRAVSLLKQLEESWGNPWVVLGRELTKLHEEIIRGSARELAEELDRRDRQRGEFVLLVQKPEGLSSDSEAEPVSTGSLKHEVDLLCANGHARNAALREVARRHGMSRRKLYERLLPDKEEEG